MEADLDQEALDGDEDTADVPLDDVDDGGTGAAIALLVALLSFLLAIVFIVLRNILFHA